MDNPVPRCNWPPLAEKYDLALREAVNFVLDRFPVCGIVASGTIIRGNPDPSSDLDIYVIHREPFRQRIQKLFHGVPAEIFVNPQAAIERYFVEEQAEGRPSAAHMLATGHVVLDLAPEVKTLREKARELISSPPEKPKGLSMTMTRYGIATIYEDAVDVAPRDPETARMLLCRAVSDMLSFRFSSAGRFLPRHKDLLRELDAFDSETAALAREFFGTLQIESQLELAGRIADRTIGARGFFEWEMPREAVSDQKARKENRR